MLAFNDIDPQGPTHVLIVPKRHIASHNDLTPDDDQIVGEVVRRAAAIARERGIAESGFRTLFNTNRGAGQTVSHIHLLVIGARPALAARLRCKNCSASEAEPHLHSPTSGGALLESG